MVNNNTAPISSNVTPTLTVPNWTPFEPDQNSLKTRKYS